MILLCFLLPMRHNQSINFGYTLAYRKNCMICIWVQSYEKYLILVDGNLKNNNFQLSIFNFQFFFVSLQIIKYYGLLWKIEI